MKSLPFWRRILPAWLLTGVIDGVFSSVLSAYFYGSTVARLWQGVASTLMGPSAIDGGLQPAAIGVLMHFGVALGWTVVFVLALDRSEALRRIVARKGGPIAIAAVYGPIVWMVMSLLIVPQLTHRPPAITFRWWVQFFGHIPFVALPIVAVTAYARGLAPRRKVRAPVFAR